MRYVQKSYEEARAENFPAPFDEDWDDFLEYVDDPWFECAIWRIEDDGTMSVVVTDGGESEDNYLRRDWSWVVGELNRAFENGFRFGYNKAHGEMQVDEGISTQ